MQLFGLVNALLASERRTARVNLSIQRYAILPLSNNSGLIGWVPSCDTMHQLIKQYRESKVSTVFGLFRLECCGFGYLGVGVGVIGDGVGGVGGVVAVVGVGVGVGVSVGVGVGVGVGVVAAVAFAVVVAVVVCGCFF